MAGERAWWAQVTAVGTAADQIGQIKAVWPDMGGEYPGWLDHGGSGGAFEMPAVGDFVEVAERAREPGRFEWVKIATRPNRLPAEARAAHPDVACTVAPSRKCYLVVGAGKAILEGETEILIGKGASHPIPRGDYDQKLLQGILDLLASMVLVVPGVGGVALTSDLTGVNAYGVGGLEAVKALMEAAPDGLAGLKSEKAKVE